MMFATKLLLKYAVKPTSPPRTILPQEITKTFQHEPIKQYTTNCISKSEAKQALQEANLIKSLRFQKHKLCSRSEPKRASRRSLSEIEHSIINHPNFEKAAALVELLGDNTFTKRHPPHRIGSMPKNIVQYTVNPDAKAVEAAVKIVKNALQAKIDMEKEEKLENEEVDNKEVEQNKPYVINIYLDTKQSKKLEDAEIKKKIKQFWEENVKESERKNQNDTIRRNTQDNIMVNTASNAVLRKIEQTEQEEKTLEKKEVGNEKKNSEINVNEVEISEETPKYRNSPVQKLYPDPASTVNPHTERLAAGTPVNYDLEERIKEVMAKVTPVNTNGFSKYLKFWKDMWAKKQEVQEIEEEYTPKKEDQPKLRFRKIKNDNLFGEKTVKKRNPYNSSLEQEETSEQEQKDSKQVEAEDVDSKEKQKPSHKHQQRNYSTATNPTPYLRGFNTGKNTCRKSKGTTHMQITELLNFKSKVNSEFGHKKHLSTLCKPACKHDEKTSGGMGSKTADKKSKTNQTRVDEFVDKLKDALSTETKTDFKEIKVIYSQKQQDQNARGQIKVANRNWSKVEGRPSNIRISERDELEDVNKAEDDVKKTIHTGKKK